MRLSANHLTLLLGVAAGGSALVTLDTIRQITNITLSCTADIKGLSLAAPVVPLLIQDGQQPLSGTVEGMGDRDEIEIVIAAALRYVDSKIVEFLNIPLKDDKTAPKADCKTVASEYRAFLASTTLFIRAVEDKQVEYRWDGDSLVFDALAWMQSLWASRTANNQHLSFIEQQLALYSSTTCFGKNEVLRRDVEIVEYVNDLLDSFN